MEGISSLLDKNIALILYLTTCWTPGQIREARAMLGLTQAALAELAGLSITALNNIESG
jgi:DNA-binding XRE family transcriptional regulator